MANEKAHVEIQLGRIADRIFWVRGHKVILDRDLAVLYGIETRVLKQAVRRNKERFPQDFLFVLSVGEQEELVSQNVIPSKRHFGGAAPMVFTELGVAMLSSVLNSPKAVQVNIAIMRTFVELRRLMDGNRVLADRIHALEEKYDQQFELVFAAIKQLLVDEKKRLNKSKRRVGFHP